MVRKFKSIALAGAFVMVASPVFAQDMQLPLIGNMDLDPMHIFSPAPAAPEAAPAAAPMKKMHKKKMHKKMMKKKM